MNWKIKKIYYCSISFLIALFIALANGSGFNLSKAAENDKYTGWEIDGTPLIYVSKNGEDEIGKEGYLAYCFSHNRATPGTVIKGGTSFTETASTPSDFGPIKENEQTDQAKNEKLVNDLKRAIYNGYPYDASKLSAKLSLDLFDNSKFKKEVAFAEATQWAIWHYSNEDFDVDTEITKINDKKKAVGNFSQKDQKISDLQREIYNALIDSTKTQTPPDTFNLKAFKTEVVREGKRVQNLVVTDHKKEKPKEDQFGRDEPIYIAKAGLNKGKIETKGLTGAHFKVYDGIGTKGKVLHEFDSFGGLELGDSGEQLDLRTIGTKFGK